MIWFTSVYTVLFVECDFSFYIFRLFYFCMLHLMYWSRMNYERRSLSEIENQKFSELSIYDVVVNIVVSLRKQWNVVAAVISCVEYGSESCYIDVLFWLQAIHCSSEVEISPERSMIRTKYSPEKWPMLTTLKVDAPEFVPRTQRAGNKYSAFRAQSITALICDVTH